ERVEGERERRRRVDLVNSLSRNVTYDDPEEDERDRAALGTEVVDLNEGDDELDEELERYLALDIGERLDLVVRELREKWCYCFWCKCRYKDREEMERECPGQGEEEHGHNGDIPYFNSTSCTFQENIMGRLLNIVRQLTSNILKMLSKPLLPLAECLNIRQHNNTTAPSRQTRLGTGIFEIAEDAPTAGNGTMVANTIEQVDIDAISPAISAPSTRCENLAKQSPPSRPSMVAHTLLHHRRWLKKLSLSSCKRSQTAATTDSKPEPNITLAAPPPSAEQAFTSVFSLNNSPSMTPAIREQHIRAVTTFKEDIRQRMKAMEEGKARSENACLRQAPASIEAFTSFSPQIHHPHESSTTSDSTLTNETSQLLYSSSKLPPLRPLTPLQTSDPKEVASLTCMRSHERHQAEYRAAGTSLDKVTLNKRSERPGDCARFQQAQDYLAQCKIEYNKARRRLNGIEASNQCLLRARTLGTTAIELDWVRKRSIQSWQRKEQKAQKCLGKASRVLRVARVALRLELEKANALSSLATKRYVGCQWFEGPRPAVLGRRSQRISERSLKRMYEGKAARCALPLIE
ncbi:MAG: hypothetical protein Q9217_006636, partial [Psora testacea]